LTWKAQKYDAYRDFKKPVITRTSGYAYNTNIETQSDDKPKLSTLRAGDLPESFDSREKWPKCESIKEIRDQGDCGGCWAVSAGATFSDRVCIHSGDGSDQRRISAEDLLECCGLGRSSKCHGGYVPDAWTYIKNIGVVTGGMYGDQKSCKPFSFPNCSHYSEDASKNPLCTNKSVDTPSCAYKCSGQDYTSVSYDDDAIRAADTIELKGEADMMTEIYQNGPIETTMFMYDDLETYKEGIYTVVSSNYLNNHAVKVIGWGVENNVKYWIISNTWNTTWGEKGFFRIKKGTNESNIETQC